MRDPFFTLDSYAQLVTLRLPLRVHNQTVKRRTKYRVEIIADILTRIIKIDSHKKPCSQESRQIEAKYLRGSSLLYNSMTLKT